MDDIQRDFAAYLAGLSDAALQLKAEEYIWLSAYAANNARSEYHWKCDATYREAAVRDPGTGPAHRGASIYVRAHARVMRGEGYA